MNIYFSRLWVFDATFAKLRVLRGTKVLVPLMPLILLCMSLVGSGRSDRQSGVLEDICTVIGFVVTTQLVAWFGWTSLSISKGMLPKLLQLKVPPAHLAWPAPSERGPLEGPGRKGSQSLEFDVGRGSGNY
jgi:hypothetical protein